MNQKIFCLTALESPHGDKDRKSFNKFSEAF